MVTAVKRQKLLLPEGKHDKSLQLRDSTHVSSASPCRIGPLKEKPFTFSLQTLKTHQYETSQMTFL